MKNSLSFFVLLFLVGAIACSCQYDFLLLSFLRILGHVEGGEKQKFCGGGGREVLLFRRLRDRGRRGKEGAN